MSCHWTERAASRRLMSVAAALLCLSGTLCPARAQSGAIDWDNHIPGGPGDDYPNASKSTVLSDVDGLGTDVAIDWDDSTTAGPGNGTIVSFLFTTMPRVDVNNLSGFDAAGLRVAVNNANTSQFVTATFDFSDSGGARELFDLVFTIHDVDVDSSLWQDEVTITGYTAGGSLVTPTFSQPAVSITNGIPDVPQVDLDPYIDFSGATATAQFGPPEGSQGTSTDQNYGDVIVDFGLIGITSFVLSYTNGPDISGNPTLQTIGFGDFSYSLVPEPGSALLVVLGCGILGLGRRRAARAR